MMRPQNCHQRLIERFDVERLSFGNREKANRIRTRLYAQSTARHRRRPVVCAAERMRFAHRVASGASGHVTIYVDAVSIAWQATRGRVADSESFPASVQ